MTFSERIIQERKKRGWSQERLAQELNISRQAISKWETGQAYPDLETLISLSNLFNISIDELCGKQKSKNKLYKTYSKKEIILFAIFIFIIGLYMGNKMTRKESLTNDPITAASVGFDFTNEQVTVYVTPTYIHKNASYHILLQNLNGIGNDTQKEKAFLKDNVFSTTFDADINVDYDISLEIKLHNETIIVPLAQNFKYHGNGSYGYHWIADQAK